MVSVNKYLFHIAHNINHFYLSCPQLSSRIKNINDLESRKDTTSLIPSLFGLLNATKTTKVELPIRSQFVPYVINGLDHCTFNNLKNLSLVIELSPQFGMRNSTLNIMSLTDKASSKQLESIR